MKLNTRLYGTREYDETDIINFKQGLPGFRDLKKFIIFSIDENNVFSMLHSIENPEIGLIVISPFKAMKEYEFNLEEYFIKKLEVQSEEDIIVLTTVCMESKTKKLTTNLKAPIIINIKQKIGEQLILDNVKYSIKYPLLREE